MKKILSVLLCICLCSAAPIGCGEPRIDAASSVKAIYDLYILDDTSGIFSLGMTQEDVASAQAAYDSSLKEAIRANFAASGQEIDEDVLDNLYSARKKALSKMTASAEIIEKSGNKATVVLHTTYFDESALDEDAFYRAKEAAQQGNFASIGQQQEFLMDTYSSNLIQAYEKITPSADTRAISVECVVQDKIWMPANMSSFGGALAKAIAGQE